MIYYGEGSAIAAYENKTREPAPLPLDKFDHKNPKHRVVMSHAHQLGWTKPHPKHGTVAKIEQINAFLMSPRSPVKKLLIDQSPTELEKTIKALEGIVKHQI